MLVRRSWLAFVALTALSALASPACDSGGGEKTSSAGGSGGGSSNPCAPTAPECYADGPDGPGAACLARTDNTAASKAPFRVSALMVDSPPVLSQPFMQDAIITRKIDVNEPVCTQNGLGEYSVLMEFDTGGKQLTVGGGIPQALVGKPKDKGACYARFHDAHSNIDVAPITEPYTDASGKLTAQFDRIVLPIYLDDTKDNYVLLPINKVVITATLSEGNNCIGRFAPEVLIPEQTCSPPVGGFAWEPAGTLDGFITVAEAESVDVVSLNQTLCVVLSNDTAKWRGKPGHVCDTDKLTGQDVYCYDCAHAPINTNPDGSLITPPNLPDGDWCAATNSAATDTCKDAYHLVTHFAAHAMLVDVNCAGL